MDAKDLRIETALGERNDVSKYSQSGVALQCNRNKSYQDIGSNPLAKAEVAVRPCAVIGPDRVVPPASNDTYLKKAVDLWPCSEYPKPLSNVNPSRNISPRQTFQENMQRIMVPPTYSAVKHAEESNLNHVQDRNAALPKNSKQIMAPEAKYCDVPYTVNLLTNEHKNLREAEMCVPGVNSPLTRAAPHGWPPNGSNLHAPPRAYGPHDMYQYPQYQSCTGPRPSALSTTRPHRTFQEDGSYVYPDSYYQDASVRFKPYPTVKERYPQARYDYISNYPNPFHPPPYAPHKYDIPNARPPPQPYPVYPHLKYLDNRVPDPNIESYQRPSQQPISYNMQYHNQIIHPPYAPVLGNTQNKMPLYPTDKSANKLTLDTSKSYVDYENAKAKYSLPDNYFVTEMGRVHQVQKQATMPNYATPGMQPVSLPQYHRKEHMTMKNYEYMPHYRHFEHPLGYNHSGHHLSQYSPSTLAISPTDSNTSNETANTQGTSQEDGGYVSQSSTTSARSIDRLHNEYQRRYNYRYRPIVGNSQMLPKPETTSNNSKENNKINVRQFLSMWNEGDEDNTNSSTKEISIPNNYGNHENAKGHDQLYVLGLVNVPSEELAKYEHIQKVSKLPENIKGYNSIELLNQFEEVIESSNINNFKTSTPKEYIPIRDRKNAIKQIVEVLPRPISPLDVEAKISQSVIHKEVGCNFEIKPCSPKMLNVEIAAPVQNVLGERAIEKVSNPLSNKAKSPLSMRIDGNTVSNKTQQQDTHSSYENISCKLIGSPYTENRMESVKTSYSLQDLESSGVCLASLPTLDNEIELSFPEVNQQFINANKASRNLHENYSDQLNDDIVKINTLTENNEEHNDFNIINQTSTSLDDTCKENTKLSKFRKNKVTSLEYSEDESNANAIRTDSVIIENPDNMRKTEDNKDKISSLRSFGKEENTPINLTSNQERASALGTEYALDFSLNKTENGLPLLNAYDEKITNTKQDETLSENVSTYNDKNFHRENDSEHASSALNTSLNQASIEPNINTIIVKNSQGTTNASAFNENDSSSQSRDSSVNKKRLQLNVGNELDSTESNCNKSATNVIVKHRHKNKSKSLKSKKKYTIKCDSAKETIGHIDKKFYEKNVTDSIFSDKETDYTQSVIQSNIVSEEHSKIQLDVPNIDEDANSEIDTAIMNIIQDQINFDESVKMKNNNCSNLNNTTNVSQDLFTQSPLTHSDHENEENYYLNSDENKESNPGINQLDKYCTDLITKEEVINKKTHCEDTLNSCDNSLPLKEHAPGGARNIQNISTQVFSINDQEEYGFKSFVDNPLNPVLESDKNVKVDESLTLEQDIELVNSEAEVDKIRTLANDELNLKTLDGKFFNNHIEEKVDLEKGHSMDSSLVDENKLMDLEAIESTTLNIRKQQYGDDIANMDKKYSTDSGYQSSKNSFAENDVTIIELSGNPTEDSVFIENKSETNQMITCENVTANNKDNNKPPSPVSQKHFTACTSIEEVNTSLCENIKVTKLNNPNTETKNVVFDDIDANMEMIFAQPTEEKLLENKSTQCLNLTVLNDKLNSSEKMEIDINCSGHAESKKSILNHSIEITDLIIADKPLADSLNKNQEDTFATLYIKNNSCHGKELHSPWMQKLMMFNEGKTNSIDTNCSNSRLIEEDDIDFVSSTKNTSVNIAEDLKSLQESNLRSYMHDATDTSEKPEIGNSIQNVDVKSSNDNKTPLTEDVKLKPLFDSKVTIVHDISNKNACKESTDINVVLEESSGETNTTVIQNEDDKTKSIKISNTSNKNIENEFEDKSLKICNEDSEAKNCYFKEKSLAEHITSTVLENHDVDDKKALSTDMTHTVVNNDVVEKSLEMKTDLKIVEHVANESFLPYIKDVPINEGQEINLIDEEMVNNIVKKDTPDVLKMTETLDDVNLKIDLTLDEGNLKTNTSHYSDSSNNESCLDSPIFKSNIDADSQQEKNLTDFNDAIGNDCSLNNFISSQEISFRYPNNSVISQITENVLQTNDTALEIIECQENNGEDKIKRTINKEQCPTINNRGSLKRSLSDSALNGDNKELFSDLHYSWASKRNRVSELENSSLSNRRSSVHAEENVSFCILIDDNCILTEENEEKLCIAELHEEYIAEIDAGNDDDNSELLNEIDSNTYETGVDYSESLVLECENENAVPEAWVEDIACAEEVFSDEVAENVVISAPASPSDSASNYDHDEIDIYGSNCSHTDEVKFMHGDNMSDDDAQVVETLYRTPHINIMNKTLLYGDKSVESDVDQENVLIESEDWKPSPTRTPDYIDPSNASNDFRLETPENKENVLVKDLSPLRRIDDYLDSSSAENEIDEHITPHLAPISDKITQDETVYSYESTIDNLFDYKLKDELVSTTSPKSSSSSPEVSSTTSEDKNSGILLKITNMNGSRVSQINEIQRNKPRCKFTEKKGYSTSNLNFPNRPLITKAAQKYIPPIKESIRDLKVKITLPQQSLLKLKHLKMSRSEPKVVHKQLGSIPRIIKKPKPNFDDVLKSIDEIQIKRHKEKTKKNKSVIPKVLIKKNENGSHYASTPKKDTFSPDLTGRKWQPWVFLEKNHFIDKMAIKNKTKAIFSHRKNTFVLAEKFKKYKSVSNTKFVITQPKTGQLKYTIRLKHSH